MTSLALYTGAGAILVVLGFWTILTRSHLIWKVLAFNVTGTGIFMLLLSAAPRLDPGRADPVPQAMVLTGIVVTAAATAVALGLALRVMARTGSPFLEEDRSPGGRSAGDAERLGGSRTTRGEEG